jgi:RHS repeat-associated protein
LDREIMMIFQDGSTRTSAYDEASNVIAYTDEIGNVFANVFDALSREVSTDIAITDVDVSTNTQSQSFAFDGLSRATFARDSNMPLGESGAYADVNLFYDSIDRVLEVSQAFGGNTRDVTNTQFKSYPVAQFQFPASGGRKIDNAYDALYRRTSVNEDSTSANIAQWYFFGPSRVAQVVLGSGLVCTMMNNAGTNSAVQGGMPGVPNPPWGSFATYRLGYDGAGRMISKAYRCFGFEVPFQAVVGFTTAFDRASNKLYERALHAEERSHLYEPYDSSQIPQGGYDSLDRLLQYQRGTLSATGGDGGSGSGSIATGEAITLSNTDSQRSYLLDGLGNWRNTVFTPATTGTPAQQAETRQHNGLNEITRRSNSSISELINPTYDLNGNLTFDGTLNYQWDALNRLAAALSGETTVGAYSYDALNRRICKTIGSASTDFIYFGWRCFEDRNPDAEGGDSPIAQYVWDRYLDELIQITTLVPITTGSGESEHTYAAGTYYPLQDLLYRTTATVTISSDGTFATVVEAYDTDAYGNTLIFNAAGTGGNWWADNAVQVSNSLCQFLFTGQRFDAETGLYCYKRRYYSPVLGRFIGRDPALFDAYASNLQQYVGGLPSVYVDPIGMQEGDSSGSLLGGAPWQPSQPGIQFTTPPTPPPFYSSSGTGPGQGGGIERVIVETGMYYKPPPPQAQPPTPPSLPNLATLFAPPKPAPPSCGIWNPATDPCQTTAKCIAVSASAAAMLTVCNIALVIMPASRVSYGTCCTAVGKLQYIMNNCMQHALEPGEAKLKAILDDAAAACKVGAPIVVPWSKLIQFTL